MTARLTEYDMANMDAIMRGYGTYFSAQLLRLIAKADLENRELIRLGFPDHVKAYEEWVQNYQGMSE